MKNVGIVYLATHEAAPVNVLADIITLTGSTPLVWINRPAMAV